MGARAAPVRCGGALILYGDRAVSTLAVLPLGAALTGSSELFRYLRRSVNAFDSVDAFCRRLERAGFEHVSVHAMDGWQRGIAHTFCAST